MEEVCVSASETDSDVTELKRRQHLVFACHGVIVIVMVEANCL